MLLAHFYAYSITSKTNRKCYLFATVLYIASTVLQYCIVMHRSTVHYRKTQCILSTVFSTKLFHFCTATSALLYSLPKMDEISLKKLSTIRTAFALSTIHWTCFALEMS